MEPVLFLLLYFMILSAMTFFAYGIDKSKARKGKRRISERTLLGLGAVGGALGGLVGMKVYHHKTLHKYFWVINFLALAVHIAVVIALLGR